MKNKKKSLIAIAVAVPARLPSLSTAFLQNTGLMTQLKTGTVYGYTEGAFKGDKALTRYAVIVAKAMVKSSQQSSQLDQETKVAWLTSGGIS